MELKGLEVGKIKVFEAFSNVGATRLALNTINCDAEFIGISETNFDAIMMYDSLHNKKDSFSSKLSDEEMLDWIEDKNVGEEISIFSSDGKYGIKKFYEANIRSKNYGDIALINPNEIEDFDLMTYKFHPKSIPFLHEHHNGKFVLYTGEPSARVVGCSRVIEAKMPKYLLYESDECTVSSTYGINFSHWVKFLEGLGYKNYRREMRYKEFDTPQNKIRTFMFSVLGGSDELQMPKGEETTLRVRDILERNVSRKYYLKKEFEMVDRDKTADWWCQVNVVAKLIDRKKYSNLSNIVSRNGILPAISSTVGGGKVPKILVGKPTQMNIFSIDNMVAREITPMEAWKFSGYTEEDYLKLSEVTKRKTVLYLRAGKSSNPKILESIFKVFLKDYTK